MLSYMWRRYLAIGWFGGGSSAQVGLHHLTLAANTTKLLVRSVGVLYTCCTRPADRDPLIQVDPLRHLPTKLRVACRNAGT